MIRLNLKRGCNANDNDEQLIANGYFKANPEGWYDSLNYTSSVNLFEIISRLKHKIEMGFLIILITEYQSDWLLSLILAFEYDGETNRVSYAYRINQTKRNHEMLLIYRPNVSLSIFPEDMREGNDVRRRLFQSWNIIRGWWRCGVGVNTEL